LIYRKTQYLFRRYNTIRYMVIFDISSHH